MGLTVAFVVGLLLAAAVAAAWVQFVRSRPDDLSVRVTRTLVPIGLAVALVCMARDSVYYGLFPSWGAARLAVSEWFVRSHTLYFGQHGGPLLGAVYSPLYFLYFLPATLLPGPTVALIAASFWGAIAALAPGIWVHSQIPPSTPDRRLWTVAGATAFFVAATTLFPIRYAIFTIRGDAPLVGFLAISACLLYRSVKPGTAALWGTAACLVLAGWCKQTAAPAFLAIPLFVFAADGFAQAFRLTVRILLLLVVTVTLAIAVFSFRPLFFSTVELMAHDPWQYFTCFQANAPCRKVVTSSDRIVTMLWMLQQSISEHLAVVLTMLLVFGLCLVFAPRASIREWIRNHRWTVFIFVGAIMVPMSIANRLKVGGEDSALVLVVYFLLFGITLGLVDFATYSTDTNRIAKVALCAFMTAYILQAGSSIESFPRIASSIGTNPQKVAVEYLRSHPGRVYYPATPLPYILVENAAYNTDYYVDEFQMDGFTIPLAEYRAHIPQGFTMIAYPPLYGDAQQRSALKFLPEFDRQIKVPELDGWTVFTTASQQPPDVSSTSKARPAVVYP